MAGCNTVPSWVQIKHTELSSLLLPYLWHLSPWESNTHSKWKTTSRVRPSLKVSLQQDGRDRATAPCGIPNQSRRKEYCRLTGHSHYRSPTVVATDVSILNLDSHGSLSVTSECQVPFRKLYHTSLWLPHLRNPDALVIQFRPRSRPTSVTARPLPTNADPKWGL